MAWGLNSFITCWSSWKSDSRRAGRFCPWLGGKRITPASSSLTSLPWLTTTPYPVMFRPGSIPITRVSSWGAPAIRKDCNIQRAVGSSQMSVSCQYWWASATYPQWFLVTEPRNSKFAKDVPNFEFRISVRATDHGQLKADVLNGVSNQASRRPREWWRRWWVFAAWRRTARLAKRAGRSPRPSKDCATGNIVPNLFHPVRARAYGPDRLLPTDRSGGSHAKRRHPGPPC